MNRPIVLLVLAAILAAATPARAAEPDGPRLAISISTEGPGAEEVGSGVITTGPSGERPRLLVGGEGFYVGDSLSWSASGERLVFPVDGVESAAEEPFGTGWSVAAVAKLDVDATDAFPRGFLNGGRPVMSPDGKSVVFQRVKLFKTLPGRESYLFKSSIWRLDVGTARLGV